MTHTTLKQGPITFCRRWGYGGGDFSKWGGVFRFSWASSCVHAVVLIVLSIWGAASSAGVLVLLELGCGTPHACRRAFIDSGPKGGGRPACLARSSSRYILLCIPMVGFNSSSRIILHVSLCSPRIAPRSNAIIFFMKMHSPCHWRAPMQSFPGMVELATLPGSCVVLYQILQAAYWKYLFSSWQNPPHMIIFFIRRRWLIRIL